MARITPTPTRLLGALPGGQARLRNGCDPAARAALASWRRHPAEAARVLAGSAERPPPPPDVEPSDDELRRLVAAATIDDATLAAIDDAARRPDPAVHTAERLDAGPLGPRQSPLYARGAPNAAGVVVLCSAGLVVIGLVQLVSAAPAIAAWLWAALDALVQWALRGGA